MSNINLMQGDCLERMKEIADGSVDMILTDPPYGTTACKWDSIISLEPMWEQLERIIRPNGMIVMTASQPFTTKLIASNIENFSHQWVWDKKMAANPLLCKKMPMKNFEDVIVFCFNYNKHDYRRAYFKGLLNYIGNSKAHIVKTINQGLDHCFRFSSKQFDIPTESNYRLLTEAFNLKLFPGYLQYSEITKHARTYNPQMVVRGDIVKKGFKGRLSKDSFMGAVDIDTRAFNNTYYPQSIIQISNRQKLTVHPTQKPVALMEYLIKTYTNAGDTVLDFTMGSGTTGVAAKNLSRDFIGIEMDESYFQIAKNRIHQA